MSLRAVVDPLEVIQLAHEGASLRAIARQLSRTSQVSYGTVRKVYRELVEAGRIDLAKRAAAQKLNPPSRGGRPQRKAT